MASRRAFWNRLGRSSRADRNGTRCLGRGCNDEPLRTRVGISSTVPEIERLANLGLLLRDSQARVDDASDAISGGDGAGDAPGRSENLTRTAPEKTHTQKVVGTRLYKNFTRHFFSFRHSVNTFLCQQRLLRTRSSRM